MTRLVLAALLTVVSVVPNGRTPAAPPQRGPAYYTEVHGVGALLQCMAANLG